MLNPSTIKNATYMTRICAHNKEYKDMLKYLHIMLGVMAYYSEPMWN